MQDRLSSIKPRLQACDHTLVTFDLKAQYRALCEGCGIIPGGMYEDPKVADWLLDPGGKQKNLHRMVNTYTPYEVHLLEG